jgi:MFS family permease
VAVERSFLSWREIPGGVWALGFVSLLMDLSSEMIHALLPLYLVTVLGASMLTVGMIEGVAEAIAMITKIFSGALSDYIGKRKVLAALGYGLAAFTKPIFPLAPTIGWLVTARFVDRVGKGIRSAPRDALIADLAPADLRGASYGLRQSLDTIGAVLGPLLALVLMYALADNFSAVFWIAVVPAFASFAVILLWVHEPERPTTKGDGKTRLTFAALAKLGRAYWLVVIVASVFTLARFSEAFLLLRAQSIGLPLALVPGVMVVMNVVYALVAWPAGTLSDTFGRYGLLAVGFGLLLVADLTLAFASSVVWLAVGVALWGLHMGLTQGLLASLVADTSPAALRGTAFGLFNLLTGLATLVASVIAGAMWDRIGPAGTFLAGALFTAVALLTLLPLRANVAPQSV